MTIREIAEIAGVSASTVSKIINGKNGGIKEETRERVLAVVKAYNYAPYANALAANVSNTRLLGVLLREGAAGSAMLEGALRRAQSEGYGAITAVSTGSEEELRNISMLLAHRVDGVLWQRGGWDTAGGEKEFLRREIPYITTDSERPPEHDGPCVDFHGAGSLATEELMKHKHQKIACVVPGLDREDARSFLAGYDRCLYQGGLPANGAYRLIWDGQDDKLDRLFLTCTGFVCFDAAIAARVRERANRKNYRIPRDISIVHLGHGEGCEGKLSRLPVPYAAFGGFCCGSLIASVEGRTAPERFEEPMAVESGASVDVPITVRNKRIVVVGAINTDTLVNVSSIPQMGETTTAKSYAVMPGGKGVNQAIGAAKLGMEVCLIGRRGKDYQGDSLIDMLLEYNIDVSAVKADEGVATGHAYIYVRESGESSIVICEGANRNLTPDDIEEAGQSFRNASFCLLQTEIPAETVERAAGIARRHGAKVLLKPAAIDEISDSLLRNVDIFLPNLNELDRLCPGSLPMEEKAERFLRRGAGAVIVTLAHEGCYLRDAERSEYFPAADFQPVDTTGAADAFAATLAVYLTEGRDVTAAIRYANYAAGFSITRQGVPPALVDKSTLELYVGNQT